jgi:hypothetical protein
MVADDSAQPSCATAPRVVQKDAADGIGIPGRPDERARLNTRRGWFRLTTFLAATQIWVVPTIAASVRDPH